MSLDAGQLRKDFPALQQKVNSGELVYLDNAATTQKPEQVIDRIQEYYEEENANPGRSLHELARRSTERYRESRKTVADFIGATPGETVFTRNTTESINLVASSLELEGRILVPEFAHHSEQLPWRRKAGREDLDIEFIPHENGRIDMEAFRELMDEDVALVTVPQVSNVFGARNPVNGIVEVAHRHDAYVMVDGAQSVPRMPVDVKGLGADFLAFSGHKMLGPDGIGVLYGRRELLEEMEPYQVGGGMIRSVKHDSVEWEELPAKFEAGTPNVSGAVGLAAAIDYLEEIGMENVQEHDRELTQMMIEGLEEMEGVTVYSPRDASLVSFTMETAHPHDISEILNREGVAIRAGYHCAQPLMESLGVSSTARASPYLYNTEEDVEKFLLAAEKVREVFD
ncbi:MAG: aminotransferase class V-fold PLP-dependent enzyme [Candidatus Nanohaloarchaea archaeon]